MASLGSNKSYREYVGEGYYVWIIYCPCGEYLGVNYPSNWCDKHQTPESRKNL